MKTRDIGQEILDGIEEIKTWQKGEKKLKTRRLVMPVAQDVAKIHHKLGVRQQSLGGVRKS